jgi:hypothetical protein
LTVIFDLLVTTVLVGPDRGEFQAIERALAGQGLASVPLTHPPVARRILFTHPHRQQRIAQGLEIER